MRAWRRALAVTCLALGSSGQEPPTPAPDTPERAADGVLAAWKAKDAEALRALASRDNPDPWLVADELCARGEHDAAAAFASAAPRGDTARLPEYVAAERRAPTDAAHRKALLECNAALIARDYEAALRLAASVSRGESVSAIRLLRARGLALRALERWEESAKAFEATVEAAKARGWLARAAIALNERGLLHAGRADSRAAVTDWEKLAELERERQNPGGEAWALLGAGDAHWNLAEYGASLERHERACRIAREIGNRVYEANALLGIGNVYWSLGEYRKALGPTGEAMHLYESAGFPALAALAASNLGNIHWNLGEYAEALEHHERALRVAREVGNRNLEADALLNGASVYHARGDYRRALDQTTEAMRLYEEARNRPRVALAVAKLGLISWSLGRYSKSLEYQEQALVAARDIGDRRMEADALLNIGNVHWGLGDYRRALDLAYEAMRVYDETGYRGGVALACGNLGNIFLKLGEYAKSLAQHERALGIARDIGDRMMEADALLNMGNVYVGIGEQRLALDRYEAARAIYDGLGNRSRVGLALGNIGSVHENLGEYGDALACHQRALAVAKETGDRSLEAASLLNAATAERLLGSGDAAMRHLQEALRIRQDLGDRGGEALVLGNIAQIHQDGGRNGDAGSFRERALALARETGARETEVLNLMGLAQVALAQERPAEAAARAREALAGTLLLTSRFEYEGSVNARERWTELQETGIRAAMRLDDPAEVTFFLESARGSALLESLGGRDALRDVAIPEDLAGEERAARIAVAEARACLGNALPRGERAEIGEANASLRKAEEDLLAAIARIQRAAKATADVAYPRTATVAELQGTVREGEALVEYVLLSDEALALVIAPGMARLVRLGKTSDLDRLVAGLAPEDKGTDVEAPVGKLREALVAPLALTAGTRRLLVSPHGSLSRVPFALLAPDREIVYVPSGTTYRLLLDEKPRRGDLVLAVGDPAYGDPRAPALPGSSALGRLPATAEEAKAAGDVVLLGADATKPGLLAALASRPRWRAVHLACHGILDAERPMLSCLALAPGGGEEGLLAAVDVFRMKVPADLVVLSACETARGRIYQSEGVVGLVRAFMFAGAPRVVASLWKVDDEATRALMVRFYALWNPKSGSEGLPAATALKQAMEFVRDHPDHPEWRQPVYWAAWQLWGLGR